MREREEAFLCVGFQNLGPDTALSLAHSYTLTQRDTHTQSCTTALKSHTLALRVSKTLSRCSLEVWHLVHHSCNFQESLITLDVQNLGAHPFF